MTDIKITVPKASIVTLAARAAEVADRRSTMPILSSALISTEKNQLTVSATDLYMSITGSVECEANKPGAFAVPAKEFVDRINAMPDGPLELAYRNEQIVMKSKVSARRYTLRTISAEDFPKLPQMPTGDAGFDMRVNTFSTLIASTIHAVSTDESRAALNGALFECNGEQMRMVTTDGHRLAKVEAAIDGMKEQRMLIPLAALNELRRLLDVFAKDAAANDDGIPSFKMATDGVNAFVADGSLTFSFKLIDAQFPPYQQVIPHEQPNRVTVDRKALLDALKAVWLKSEKGSVWEFADGKLRLSVESPDVGDAFDEIPFDGTVKSHAKIGISAAYAIDALAAAGNVGADTIDISFSGELDPVAFRAPGFESVVMPVRI